MACTNCSTKKDDSGIPKGCGSKGSCGTDSCNKLSVFDWLSNMHYPSGFEPFDMVEVRFKNGRKDFYKNTEKCIFFHYFLSVKCNKLVSTPSISSKLTFLSSPPVYPVRLFEAPITR